ncbi:MAG: hypothetical protein ABIH42_03740 [Planctomycetota bacterium]
MKIRLIISAVVILLGAVLIITGLIPNQLALHSRNTKTGAIESETFRGGELSLIYTFSKG